MLFAILSPISFMVISSSYVVPTNEELMIAKETEKIVKRKGNN